MAQHHLGAVTIQSSNGNLPQLYVSDGLQGNSFLPPMAYSKSHTGELYFGGSNGFNAFYPEQIKDNPHIPPVVITDFQLANRPVPIGGGSVLQKSILETRHLTLTYLDRVFSFKFAALNYRAPEKNRYRYKMEGFETEWTEVDSSRSFATYTNLDPGEYTFIVTGSNNGGVWNEKGASISIKITPPWWETIWFRGGDSVDQPGFGYFHLANKSRRETEISAYTSGSGSHTGAEGRERSG